MAVDDAGAGEPAQDLGDGGRIDRRRAWPRALPNSMDAEQGLLGAILLDNANYYRAANLVAADDFYDPLHGRIFAAAERLILDGRVAKPTMMEPYFRGEKIDDELSVIGYLGRLVGAAAVAMSVADYAKLIREQAHRRLLMGVAADLSEEADEASLSPEQAAMSAISGLDRILLQAARRQTRFTLGQAAEEALDQIEHGAPRIPTGLYSLDRMLGGYARGELVVVGGRTSMGKSSFCSSTMLSTVKRGNAGVLYLSLEMTAAALAQRCMTDLLADEFAYKGEPGIPYTAFNRPGSLSEEQKQLLRRAAGDLAKLPFVIDDKAGLSIAEIGARIRQQIERFKRKGRPLDVVVIDHLGKIKPSGNYRGDRVSETGEAIGALAEMAKTYNVAIMAAVQLNRDSEKRSAKNPMLADIRWSGDVEQDADVVLLLYRPAYYLVQQAAAEDDADKKAELEQTARQLQHDMQVIIAKQRQGALGTANVRAELEFNAIRDGQGS